MALLSDAPATRMPTGRRRLTTLLAVLALLATALTVEAVRSTAGSGSGAGSVATGGSPSLEQEMFELLNRERRREGLRPLRRAAGVDNVAREWADEMATTQHLHHRPGLAEPFVGGWRRLGENVGVGYAADSLHDAFMNSSGHRANVLGDYEHVGIGVALAGRNVWVTFNFVKGDPAVASRYRTNPMTGYADGAGGGGPFMDIDGDIHQRTIGALDRRDIAISCATNRYCPDDGLRRAEMAELLVRALDLPPARERFRDVDGDHRYAEAIGALAAAGITRGCNPPANDRFCPEREVSRSQMASFFARALGLPSTHERFRDVDSRNVHHRTIGALAASGITRGCNPPANDRFCPHDDVTRAQMASFIDRMLRR